MTSKEETADRVDGEQFSTAPKMSGHTDWLRVTHGPTVCLPGFFSPALWGQGWAGRILFQNENSQSKCFWLNTSFLTGAKGAENQLFLLQFPRGVVLNAMSTGALSGGKAEGQASTWVRGIAKGAKDICLYMAHTSRKELGNRRPQRDTAEAGFNCQSKLC